MKQLLLSDIKSIERIFSFTDETLVQSCIQGYMGNAWADDNKNPTCALIVAAEFALIGGDSTSPTAKKLASFIPPGYKYETLIVIPQNDEWCKLIEAYNTSWRCGVRYAIKKEGDVFDRAKLRAFSDNLNPKYKIRRIDNELYYQAMQNELFRAFVCHFKSAQDFLDNGIGFCAMDGDKIIGGASSYSIYNGGIEIEIATDKNYRRQGVALACGAALILECLEKNLYPSWDAANKASVALSQKLGYSFNYSYPVYFLPAKNS